VRTLFGDCVAPASELLFFGEQLHPLLKPFFARDDSAPGGSGPIWLSLQVSLKDVISYGRRISEGNSCHRRDRALRLCLVGVPFLFFAAGGAGERADAARSAASLTRSKVLAQLPSKLLTHRS
jgi:hypothetical protein